MLDSAFTNGSANHISKRELYQPLNVSYTEYIMHIRRRAFTLIELMVTIGVIAVLASLVVVTLTEQRRSARDANRQLAIGEYTTAFQQYFAQNRTYMLAPAPCTVSNTSEIYPGSGTLSFFLPVGTGTGCVGYKGGGWGSINRHASTEIFDYGVNSIADSLRVAGFLTRVSTDPRTNGGFPTKPVSYFKASDGPGLSAFDDYILTLCTNEGKPATSRLEATEFALYTQLEREPKVVNSHAVSSAQQCGGPETGYGWDTIQ
jgi:prepilin-type N-terminal cleavage/methylation domain-containing protein